MGGIILQNRPNFARTVVEAIFKLYTFGEPTETQGPCPGKVSVSTPLLQAPIFVSMLSDGPCAASKGAARNYGAMRQPQLHTNNNFGTWSAH
jgi:hypothetical protein